MLEVLRRRAARAGLIERIETHVASDDSIGLQGCDNRFDFALAFAMVHEVKDPARLIGEIHRLLKGGGSLLLVEPAGHVTAPAFEQTISLASLAGFVEAGRPQIRLSYAAVLIKSD